MHPGLLSYFVHIKTTKIKCFRHCLLPAGVRAKSTGKKINFPLDLHNVFFKILVWVVFIYIKAGSPLAM